MGDVLIRNIPPEDLASLDVQAKAAGLSRNDFLRRQLISQARTGVVRVTADDLRGFADLVTDLDDADVMRQAWT